MKTPIGLDATLPIVYLFKEAIDLLWQKRTQVIKMFLPIVVLLAFIDWATRNLLSLDDLSLKAAFIALSSLFSVLLATASHQFTLLPEQQRNYTQVIRIWGLNEFRYLLRTLQISILALILFMLVMLALMLIGDNPELAYVAAFVALVPTLYILSRLSIVLPEAALGKATSLKRAWGLSEGNGVRLCLVVFLIPILSMSPFLALFLVDSFLLSYIAALGLYVTTLISLVALSLSYRFLSDFYDQNKLRA